MLRAPRRRAPGLEAQQWPEAAARLRRRTLRGRARRGRQGPGRRHSPPALGLPFLPRPVSTTLPPPPPLLFPTPPSRLLSRPAPRDPPCVSAHAADASGRGDAEAPDPERDLAAASFLHRFVRPPPSARPARDPGSCSFQRPRGWRPRGRERRRGPGAKRSSAAPEDVGGDSFEST